jgi:hypothetical protein
MPPQPLFLSAHIFGIMEHRKRQLKNAVREIDRTTIDHASSDEALAERLAQHYGLDVPILDEANKYATKEEVDVVVHRSADGTPVFNVSGGPVRRRGLRVTIIVPFKGDPSLFNVQPTAFDSNPPMAELHKGDIRLVYELADPAFDINAACERTLSQVNRYLSNLRPSAEQLATELKQLALSSIAVRRRESSSQSQILRSLKMPIREPDPPARSRASGSGTERRKDQDSKETQRWDVFVCHASEDKKEIADPLAKELKARGLGVWYDDFSLKLGDSLRQSIDRGLARSRFGVVILSAHFFEKHWPQQELNGLATREANGQRVILPVWHGVGFAEVSEYSPILADRKAVQTSEGLEKIIEKILEVVLV